MDLAISDDYAALEVGNYSFYYGYEETVPKRVDYDTDEDYEWAFVAWRDGEEIMRSTQEELGGPKAVWEDPERTLLRGIGKFIEENW